MKNIAIGIGKNDNIVKDIKEYIQNEKYTLFE